MTLPEFVIAIVLITLVLGICIDVWRSRNPTKGLTSKEHLFLRVLSVVAIIDAVTFYAASRNLQTFTANFTEVIALITVLTLFVLTINLEFWWRYNRRPDDKRFWGIQRAEPETS